MMSRGAVGQQIGADQLHQPAQPRTPRKTECHERASGQSGEYSPLHRNFAVSPRKYMFHKPSSFRKCVNLSDFAPISIVCIFTEASYPLDHVRWPIYCAAHGCKKRSTSYSSDYP